MDTLLHIVQTINSYLSDYILVILLVATGLYFTIRTRFVQVRCFGEGMRKVFGNFNMHGGKHEGGMSSLPGADHCHCRSGRNRQHCRRLAVQFWSAVPVQSSGCGIIAFFWHGHHLCRSRAGAGDPDHP